jgi:Arc/MetJ family transcription regulator
LILDSSAIVAKGRHPDQAIVQKMVYPLHMARTNIDLDDALVKRVMHDYHLSSKRAAVDFALRRLDLEPMTREEALAMQGTGWDGDLDEMRRNWMPVESDAA